MCGITDVSDRKKKKCYVIHMQQKKEEKKTKLKIRNSDKDTRSN